MLIPGDPSLRVRLASIAAILTIAGGCRYDVEKYAAVSGTVMAGGKAVTGAVITFEPVDDTPGPKASAAIVNGRFKIGPQAQLRDGRYRIRIAMLPAEMQQTIRETMPDAFPPADSTIAPKHDSQSDVLRVITTDSENTFHFSVDLL